MEGNWVLARLRLPYRRFEIVSTLSREAAAARINGIVEPHSPLIATFVRTNKLFAGDLSSDRFKIKRIVNYRDTMVPVIEGVFEPSPSGSRIRITMRLAHWVAAFFVLWCGGTTIMFLLSALGLLPSSHPTSSLSWLFPLAFVYVMSAIGFNSEADKARGLLEEALRATPSGPVEQVLSNVVKPKLSWYVKGRLAAGAVITVLATFMWLLSPQSQFRVAQDFIEDNRTIRGELGSVSSIERLNDDHFYKSEKDQPNEANFQVNVTGEQQSGVVLFGMERHDRVWTIKSAQLREADGRTMLLAAPAAD
jgi:hypothetical protein